jgi:hypothetical protein
MKEFQTIVDFLVGLGAPGGSGPAAVDAPGQLDQEATDEAGRARLLNAAFLVALCGAGHPGYPRARGVLERLQKDPALQQAARHHVEGLSCVPSEVRRRCDRDPAFRDRLREVAAWSRGPEAGRDPWETAERLWSVFFPEAAGIRGRERERARELRESREVRVSSLSRAPVRDPGRQVLFTANVLLTTPINGSPPAGRISDDLRRRLEPVLKEPQKTWYDHPVPVGVPPENNEILYGLKGLDEAAAFEKGRGTLSPDGRLVCLLSVSATHDGLHRTARDYIREEIRAFGGFRNLHVFAFTESDTRKLGREVLRPAAERYLGGVHPAAAFPEVFGVDGEYGRHYSFLKAVAPLWQLLVDPSVRATFKIDLDQVFPQERLTAETGASALEHMTSPLWGAEGRDARGRPVELGLLAGALVNEGDIHKGLFTPDVRFPAHPPAGEELVFFSALPQALSTEAEMMTRYGLRGLDGKRCCIERVHVTGGTTGARVDALRRHRPFTPSFIGRAEDQAFLLSSLTGEGLRPAYVHAPGLIMRHDKASFAAEAVRSAHLSKLIGDDLRVLLFSSYAELLDETVSPLKEALDPFTGGFISRIPETVVYLRSALRAAERFASGRPGAGLRLVREGSLRIGNTLDFTRGEESPLRRVYGRERRGWTLYYDVLDALEGALERRDGEAQKLRARARRIIQQSAVT